MGSHLVAGVIGGGRQWQESRLVLDESFGDALRMAPQTPGTPLTALLFQAGVEIGKAGDAGNGHEEVAVGIAHQSFDLAFVVAPGGTCETVFEEIMGLQFTKSLGSGACAVSRDTRHGDPAVIVNDAARHAAKIGKRLVMTLAERLGALTGEGHNEDVVAVRQGHDEVVGFAFDSGNDNGGVPEIDLGVAGWMGQRDEDLLATQALLAQVILDDGVAAFKTVFIAQTLEEAASGVALLAGALGVVGQDLVDDTDERFELGTAWR